MQKVFATGKNSYMERDIMEDELMVMCKKFIEQNGITEDYDYTCIEPYELDTFVDKIAKLIGYAEKETI